MTASAHDIAAELRKRLPALGRVKLHKLLYYCQGHHSVVADEPLFHEAVVAWDMGPVVGELWADERHGRGVPEATPLDDAALNTIGYVISRYGKLSGNQLIVLTHDEPPWKSADEGRQPGTPRPIPNEHIEEHFRQLMEEDRIVDPDEVKAMLSEAPNQLLPDPSEVDTWEGLMRHIEQGSRAS